MNDQHTAESDGLRAIGPAEIQPGEMVGSAVQRREDPALITGDAEYADDIAYPGQLYMSVHRSQYAHAKIENVDTGASFGRSTWRIESSDSVSNTGILSPRDQW